MQGESFFSARPLIKFGSLNLSPMTCSDVPPPTQQRLSDYFSQPSNNVVGSIDYGLISRIPSGIHSLDAAKVSSLNQSTKLRRKSSINFSSLMGEWHWKRTYKRVYKEQQGMWLTPCELFTPYYSNILANFVSNSMKEYSQMNNDAFEIVELGGGRGTNARALLDYMKEKHRELYEKLDSYTIIDTSPTLHELQREVLISGLDDEARMHAHKIKLVNTDLMEIAEGSPPFLSQSNKPTVVIALELLDNLPHDKIARCMQSHEILQAEVVPSEVPSEVFHPLNDELIQDILLIAPGLYAPKVSQGPIWIPSVVLGVLMKLYDCRPNSSIAFADFDWLPPPDVTNSLVPALAMPAIGDPLVTDMNGQDHACYLSAPSDALCDILFPTDFSRLAAFVQRLHGAKANQGHKVSISSMKQRDFLLKHGSQEVSQTKSWLTGYSPLIDDFGNCSVFEVLPR